MDGVENSALRLYSAYLGSKSYGYYLEKFLDFDRRGGHWNPSWNWSACLFSLPWLLYRRMYRFAGLFFLLWIPFYVIGAALGKLNGYEFIGIAVQLALPIALGVYGNAIYHTIVSNKIAAALEVFTIGGDLLQHLERVGGVANRWIWAFAAIPLIGVVAATAIPALTTTKRIEQASARPELNPCGQGRTSLFDDVRCGDQGESRKIEEAAERARVEEAGRLMIAKYPFLNHQAAHRDERAIEEVIRIRDELIAGGVAPHQAIFQASETVARTFKK